MASNQHTGLNPLNIPRVDATESGINSAFATISREIAERTQRESLGEGSLHTGAGTFSVAPVAIEQVKPRHAFHAIVYMDAADSSTTKANFQAAYVIEQNGSRFSIFPTEDDQTRSVLAGERYWVKILVDDNYCVQSASFVEATAPVNVEPTDTTSGEIYKLCVEFTDDSGKLVVTYYRFDSISYFPSGKQGDMLYHDSSKWVLLKSPDAPSGSTTNIITHNGIRPRWENDDLGSLSHPWKATANGDEFINVARGHIMGFKPYTDGTYGAPSFFLPFIEILQTYVGGSVEITDATGFLYATCTVESSVEGQEGAFAGGNIEGNLYRPSAAPTVVFSDVPIASYAPLDAKVHLLLAEVSLAGGVAAVEEQLLFHNPSIQLDSLRNTP